MQEIKKNASVVEIIVGTKNFRKNTRAKNNREFKREPKREHHP